MGLNALDLAVILAYLLGVTAFGLRFRKRQRTLKDYFLADRQIPWWAISLSIVAAETSTLTIISVPGLAYETDFRFAACARLPGWAGDHQYPPDSAVFSWRTHYRLPVHRTSVRPEVARPDCRTFPGYPGR